MKIIREKIKMRRVFLKSKKRKRQKVFPQANKQTYNIQQNANLKSHWEQHTNHNKTNNHKSCSSFFQTCSKQCNADTRYFLSTPRENKRTFRSSRRFSSRLPYERPSVSIAATEFAPRRWRSKAFVHLQDGYVYPNADPGQEHLAKDIGVDAADLEGTGHSFGGFR